MDVLFTKVNKDNGGNDMVPTSTGVKRRRTFENTQNSSNIIKSSSNLYYIVCTCIAFMSTKIS